MPNSKIKALEEAQPIIKRHVIFAMGAGFIPFPIADIAAVTAVQLDMLRQLCKLYGQDYQDTSGKAFVGAVMGTTLARIAAHSVGSVFKAIPIIGSALGGMTVSAFSGAATYAIGQVVAQHFASGGSISEFDSEELKKFYEEQLKKGKDMVNDWKEEVEDLVEEVEDLVEEVEEEVTEKMDDLFENELETKLKKLEELKAAGLVTETEYKRIKNRILKQM